MLDVGNVSPYPAERVNAVGQLGSWHFMFDEDIADLMVETAEVEHWPHLIMELSRAECSSGQEIVQTVREMRVLARIHGSHFVWELVQPFSGMVKFFSADQSGRPNREESP